MDYLPESLVYDGRDLPNFVTTVTLVRQMRLELDRGNYASELPRLYYKDDL